MVACLQAVALAHPLSPPIVVGHPSPRTLLIPAAAWTRPTPTDRAHRSRRAWAPPSRRTPATPAASPRPPTSSARTPQRPSRLGATRASSRTPTTAATSIIMSTTLLQSPQWQGPQPPSGAPWTSHSGQSAAVGAAVALHSRPSHRIQPRLPTLHRLPKQPPLLESHSNQLSLHIRLLYPLSPRPLRSPLPQPPLGPVTVGSSGEYLCPRPCRPLSP